MKNQCDGCRRGLPVRKSITGSGADIHIDPKDNLPYMVCSKDMYTDKIVSSEEALGYFYKPSVH